MEMKIKTQKLESAETPLLVLGFSEKQYKALKNKFNLILSIAEQDFEGKDDQQILLYKTPFKAKRVMLIGLGEDIDYERVRKRYSMVARYMDKNKLTDASIAIPNGDKKFFKCVCESILLSHYKFDKYLDKKKKLNPIKTITFVFETKQDDNDLLALLKETNTVCENVKFVRDLVNEVTDVASPLGMEDTARKIAKNDKVKIKVLTEKEMKNIGMNLLLAVSSGSSYPPRLIILEYNGNPNTKKTLAFVGKGITFDTGGLNLKPTGYMETMREDMAGAATILGALKIVIELKLKVNLYCVIPTCENAIGSKAYKPGDIFTAYNGKTVQIENTDAEGRLVLGDALAYVQEKLKPSKVIDLATLTGAMIVCLGHQVTGMFGNNDEMCNELTAVGEETYERVWRLPMYDEFKEMIKGDVADIKNSTTKRDAGSITAACFLQEFLDEKTPWVHLDIAGTSWMDESSGYLPKNATGTGVRLLVEWLKKQ